MPLKDPEKRKAYQKINARKHYLANKEKYKERTKKRNEAQLQSNKELIAIKKNVPCMDCGTMYPTVVMDFDHRDKSQKVGDISKMALSYYGTETLLKEIAKCDVVCANCHRLRTFKV